MLSTGVLRTPETRLGKDSNCHLGWVWAGGVTGGGLDGCLPGRGHPPRVLLDLRMVRRPKTRVWVVYQDLHETGEPWFLLDPLFPSSVTVVVLWFAA